jgi:hypothetical protein
MLPDEPPVLGDLRRVFDDDGPVRMLFDAADAAVVKRLWGDWNVGLEDVRPYWHERDGVRRADCVPGAAVAIRTTCGIVLAAAAHDSA